MIDIKDLKKKYNGKTVLDIPSLRIEDNTTNYFVGENGSGKTTLILTICGFIHQDEGIILVDNHRNTASFVRKHSHVVFESGKGFYDYLTVLENIKYFLGINQIKFKNVKEQLYDLVEAFSFNEHLSKKVSELSQGNRQKAALILALIKASKYIALDEPTNGLDDGAKQVFISKFEKLRNAGSTLLISTHDIPLYNSCTNVFRLSAGRLTDDT